MPCPQPVVLVRFAVFASRSASPCACVIAHALLSQSTCTATMSSIECDQPLVAQVADGERFGRGAQRHQREELLLVDVERQRMLARDRHLARLAFSSTRRHVERRRARGVGETGDREPSVAARSYPPM